MKKYIFAFILFVLLIVLAGVEVEVLANQPLNKGYARKQFVIDPVLAKQAKKLGIDVSDVNLMYGKPKADNVDNAVGSYNPGEIIIGRGLSSNLELQVLAHEYVHHRTYSDSPEAVAQRYKGLISSRLVREKLSRYSCNRFCLGNEATAYACTKMTQDLLSVEFREYCDDLVPNRAILF